MSCRILVLAQSSKFQCIPSGSIALLEHGAVSLPSLAELTWICSLAHPQGLCCSLLVFPHLAPQSLLLLIDFCPCSCFTGWNSSCSGHKVSPQSGPQGCKSKPFFLPPPRQLLSRAHKPNKQENFPRSLISYHCETNTLGYFVQRKGAKLIN